MTLRQRFQVNRDKSNTTEGKKQNKNSSWTQCLVMSEMCVCPCLFLTLFTHPSGVSLSHDVISFHPRDFPVCRNHMLHTTWYHTCSPGLSELGITPGRLSSPVERFFIFLEGEMFFLQHSTLVESRAVIRKVWHLSDACCLSGQSSYLSASTLKPQLAAWFSSSLSLGPSVKQATAEVTSSHPAVMATLHSGSCSVVLDWSVCWVNVEFW